MSGMNRYMLLDGPLRGRAVDELPEGYEVSETSDRIGVWIKTREDFDELHAILELMTSAQARLDTQTRGEAPDGTPIVANNDETRQAISDMREANARQDRLLRRMAPDLY
ncbi:hypothetical protein QE412_002605 [Microbacterium trichothecenolyticum]|uniref:Uncharacterized protein n=2 Tax=Microbacterium trichothecenolyticum TaxID=69370 RepID=A0ABU0TWJ5_MICTR|nr:hypothetical protein [Microbacterium trichothecenolyticum]